MVHGRDRWQRAIPSKLAHIWLSLSLHPTGAALDAPDIIIHEPCISARGCSPFCRADEDISPAVFTDCDSTGDDWTRGAIWRGGELMKKLILESADVVVRGLRVIELGSGTGIVSLAAAAAGAREVTATDQILEQAAHNIALNPTLAKSIVLRPLVWGNAAQIAALGPPFGAQSIDTPPRTSHLLRGLLAARG